MPSTLHHLLHLKYVVYVVVWLVNQLKEQILLSLNEPSEQMTIKTPQCFELDFVCILLFRMKFWSTVYAEAGMP